MSTEQNNDGSAANAFIRIDPAVRDRLKAYCNKQGLVMGRFVSNVVSKAIENGPRPAPRQKARAKRKAVPKK
jgi:hypothetical protein